MRGSQPAGLERNVWSCSSGGLGWNRRWKRGLAYRKTEETALCSTGHVRNGILFIGRGLAYRKMEETDLLCSERGPVDLEGCGVPQNGGNRPPTVETGVLLIGRGVAYRTTDETDLCWSATVETGVLFIGRGVAYRKTGLHEILFISTVDLLQPPRATVDLLQPPRAPVHLAFIARYSTGYCSTTPPRAPLHRLLFIQPSTPRGPVQPPLHGHPSIVYCSSSPPHHGVLFIQRQRHRSLFIHPPHNAHCSSNRSASVSSSSEGIAPSGSVNSHRSIARVQ